MNNKNKLLLISAIICIILVFIMFITNNPDNSNKNNDNKNSQVIVEENEAHAQIIEKEEASYEEWLSAAMVTALTLQEDEFTVEHIYYKSKTTLDNKMNSSGVYIVYRAGNDTYCIHSKPLKKERTEAGTINLYTKDLGFSTFDTVSISSLNFNNYKDIEVSSLNTLISQSLLVSLYEN